MQEQSKEEFFSQPPSNRVLRLLSLRTIAELATISHQDIRPKRI